MTTVAAPIPVDDGRMSLAQFIAKYEHTYQVLPGYSTAECMALFSHYNYQLVHGDAYSAPGAQDVWLSNTWSAYDRIDASQPARRGDVVLWSGSFGAYQGGGYGHVGIVLEDHGGTLLALSQNPTPIVRLELSKYGVLGYLRPHNLKQ
ncbi:CHAP domain-containing protein [Pseudarthrobacter equi]|uniref:CHAP domain-containing protein n=1 Tax=Pseudarthrobacter equi TaxID=728066 RepID=UPI0012FE3E19|nr:CHAP domain-containing protein [Pseudarthrobacter equi]